MYKECKNSLRLFVLFLKRLYVATPSLQAVKGSGTMQAFLFLGPQGQIQFAFYSTTADNLARLESFMCSLIVSRCLIEVKGILDE